MNSGVVRSIGPMISSRKASLCMYLCLCLGAVKNVEFVSVPGL